ncbi:hypothetical protein [Paenibacillus fonticola]|uniref:hypothetical protein n=1 Tax=Paenibacillus fonticola TaxID=379896 RepID=UPI00036FE17E|nr:hypothetical protein [Paenibacillus fonticola]
MRSAVTAKLLAAVPGLNAIYSSAGEIGEEALLPCALYFQGEVDAGGAWSGLRQIIELWLYVPGLNPVGLDGLSEQTVKALDKQLLTAETGERFLCLFEESLGPDRLDEARGAMKRGLRFALIVPQALSRAVQICSDPWLNAIQEWTQEVLGPEWQIHSGSWPLGFETPAMMWRITDMEVSPRGRTFFELKKQFTAFIAGMDANQEHQAILSLVEALGRSVKIPLHPGDQTYLTVLEPRVNMNANKATEGQLSVTFSRRIADSMDKGPLMQFIQYTRI